MTEGQLGLVLLALGVCQLVCAVAVYVAGSRFAAEVSRFRQELRLQLHDSLEDCGNRAGRGAEHAGRLVVDQLKKRPRAR